jgi:hypothetical protein
MNAFTATAFAVFASVALAAAPAEAHQHWHGHGFWGGPGLIFGLAGAAIAAGVAADAYCVRYVPVYDNWGNYVGRRPVNEC